MTIAATMTNGEIRVFSIAELKEALLWGKIDWKGGHRSVIAWTIRGRVGFCRLPTRDELAGLRRSGIRRVGHSGRRRGADDPLPKPWRRIKGDSDCPGAQAHHPAPEKTRLPSIPPRIAARGAQLHSIYLPGLSVQLY